MSEQLHKECTRCGKCCITATFKFGFVKEGQNQQNLDDMSVWLSYHGCDVMQEKTDDGISYYVRIPTICRYLDITNEYACSIYNTRPDVCRRYFCNRKETIHAD